METRKQIIVILFILFNISSLKAQQTYWYLPVTQTIAPVTTPIKVAIGYDEFYHETINSKLTIFGSGWGGGIELNTTGPIGPYHYARMVCAMDGLLFRNFTGTGSIFSFRNSTDKNLINVWYDGQVEFRNSSNISLLKILSNGTIGINQTNPITSYKLHVNGSIKATSITVDFPPPAPAEFVFGDNYNLKKLEEIETFIKENKHLPDMPNVTEMPEVVNLAEVQTKFVQKIEELTLYIIEQEKRIKVLENLIDVSSDGQSISKVNNEIKEPLEYSLSSNYPNPFNPSTTIKYDIKEKGMVQLKVYDVLGKEVADLVNEIQPEGSYTVAFDANNLASGTYIYSLKINNFEDSKKMIVIK